MTTSLRQRHRIKLSIGLALSVAGLGLAGCGTYTAKHNYLPQPGHVRFDADSTDKKTNARALATVVGIRRQMPDNKKQKGVELSLRVENLSDQPLRFDPSKAMLLDAQLNELPGPVNASKPVTVPAGEHQTIALLYRLPKPVGTYADALKGLNLRLTLNTDQRAITRSLTFQRDDPYHNDGYIYRGYPYLHGGYRAYGVYGTDYWR